MRALLLALILFTNTAFGYEVKYLDQGQAAPFAGYLIEPKLEKEFRLMDKELEYNKKLVVSLDAINKSYQEQVYVMQTRIDNQSKELKELRTSDSFLSKYGLFILGCLTTTAVAFAVNRASN